MRQPCELMLHRGLMRRWQGDVEGLADTSRSALTMALCGCLKAAGFDLFDTARILLVFNEGDLFDSDKYPTPKDQVRAIARAWVRAAHPVRAETTEPWVRVRQAGIDAAQRILTEALQHAPELVDELLPVCHCQDGTTDIAFARGRTTWAQRIGVGIRDLERLRKTALQKAAGARAAAERLETTADRRIILLDASNLAQAVDDAEAALAGSAPPLIFRLGDQPVEIVERAEAPLLRDAADLANDVRLAAGPATLPVSGNLMRAALSRVAVFTTPAEIVPPPSDVAAVLVERGPGLRVPELAGMSAAPVLRPDGSILFSQGFDARTSVYATNTFEMLAGSVPTEPTREEAQAALQFLLTPFAEMLWLPASGQATHTAHILTLLTRHLIPVVPLFAYLAPVAASGKTLAAEAASRIVNGRGATLMPAVTGRDTDEEMRKRLTALLLASRSDIVFDNAARGSVFGGAPLDALLTSPTWSDRVLGASTTVTLPNRATIAVTGNNIKLSGDLGRRTLFAYLDPGQADPENRRFTIKDLRGYLHEHRATLLAAALTIMRAHLQHNHPLTGGVPAGTHNRLVRALVPPGCRRGRVGWAGQPARHSALGTCSRRHEHRRGEWPRRVPHYCARPVRKPAVHRKGRA
jgi:hypothetical protein